MDRSNFVAFFIRYRKLVFILGALFPVVVWAAVNKFDLLRANQLNVDNVQVDGNTISSTNTNGNIVLDPNGTGGVNLTDQTASRAVVLDASKNLTSSSITSAELGYLSGVTSSLCGINQSCTLTNKTISASSNTLSDIVNANISNSAAIAYSKLNLSGSVVNADVSNSAAIAYSKLNLSSSIVNADISNSAAIAYSKLASLSSGSILAGNVSNVATGTTTPVLGVAGSSLGSIGLSGNTSGVVTIRPAAAAGTYDFYLPTSMGSSGQVLTSGGSGAAPTWTSGGSGSGINYLSANPDAEGNVTTGWTTYDDGASASPVNCIDGSPGVTWTVSGSSPLRGTYSFLWTHDAADRQGEGVAYAFSIDSADKGKPQQISFDWAVNSGTWSGSVTPGTDSDLVVYVYDVTNAALIEPAGKLLEQATSGVNYSYKGVFQAASNSTSYRLCLHNAKTTATAYSLKMDNFKVGPQVISSGAAVSDWTSYTPTGSWVTNATYSGRWRRVGDSMEVTGRVLATGAPTAAQLTFSLPSGYSIDTSKLGAVNNVEPLGIAIMDDAGTGTLMGNIHYNSSTVVFVKVLDDASGSTHYGRNITEIDPVTVVNTDAIYVRFSVPISGWSSNVQMSGDTDTRIVAAIVNNGAGSSQAITGSSSKITFNTESFDSHGAYDPTTNYRYTIPVSGTYVFSGVLNTSSPASDASFQALLYKNGTAVRTQVFALRSGVAGGVSFSFQDNAVAGDYYEIFANSSVNLDVLTGATYFGGSRLDIKRLSGPSQIAASEDVIVAARNASGTSISTGTSTDLIYATVTKDTHGAYNTSTGVFTAPISGTYELYASATLTASSAFNGTSESYEIFFTDASNVIQAGTDSIVVPPSGAINVTNRTQYTVRMLSGAQLKVRAYQESGSTHSLTGNANFQNNLNIRRVGNY